jgi:hypothetical protein
LRSKIRLKKDKSPLRTLNLYKFDESSEISIKCKIPIGNKEFLQKSKESFVKTQVKKEDALKSKVKLKMRDNFTSKPMKQFLRHSSRLKLGPKVNLSSSQSTNKIKKGKIYLTVG